MSGHAAAVGGHRTAQMRLLAIAALAILWGCSSPHDDTQLRQLEAGLRQAWPKAQWALHMTLVAEDKAGRTVLRCVLENTSAEPIKVNASTFPWTTPGLFDVNAVTADGTVIHRNGVINQPMNMPEIVTLGVGQSLEGQFDLEQLPIASLARSEDVLLLWSYGLDNGSYDLHDDFPIDPARYYFVSGVTLLMKR